MSIVDYPTPVQPRAGHGVVATIAVTVGVAGAVLGIFTPAFAFYVPALLGVVTIVLAVIGHAARGRAWTAMVLAALMLAEAVYGVVQMNKAEQALNDMMSNGPAAVGDTGQIVNLKFGTTYVGPTLSVGLSKPAAYTPSDSAMVQQQTGRAVAFNITIADNDKTRAFPAMGLTYQATSGSTQDQDIEDSANNVGTSAATILPGHSLSWEIAFSVPTNATDITVAVSSVGGGKTIVFAGPLA